MRRIDSRCLVAAYIIPLLAAPLVAHAQRGAQGDAPPPAVWLESGSELAPGQPARLGYSLPRDGYLTILRATTDGDLSVVYPARPTSVSNSRSNRAGSGALPLRADAAPGVGHLFWITSSAPFDFRGYAGRDGRWSTGRLSERGDPFEQVDRFARGTTRGRYSVGYSSYRVGSQSRGSRRAPAVHDGDYGGGYADAGYAGGGYDPGAYGTGYGNRYGSTGYDDNAGWWGGHQWSGYAQDTWRYRRSWRDREYERAYDRAAYADPRSRYLRHCGDGTLAPYTVPCGASSRPSGSRTTGHPRH